MEPLNTPPLTAAPISPQPRGNRFPLWVGFAALLLIVGTAVYFAYVTYTGTSSEQSLVAELVEKNPAFAEGMSLYESGKFAEARAKFTGALAMAGDSDEESQIKLKIAHAVRDSGDVIEAIRLYKEIVLNESYPARSRAYASQAVAVIAEFTFDPTVRGEIFNGAPYEELRNPNSYARSNRRLFEFSAELYPLALSELHVALWFANRLRLDTFGTIDLTAAEIGEFQSNIAARMQRADADIARIRTDPNDAVPLPEILRVRALTLSALAFAGYGSHQEADSAYREALAEYARLGAPEDVYMRLWYGYYLAGIDARKGEVAAIVAPLYTDPAYRSQEITAYLASERGNVTGARRPLNLIASSDPKFKEFLISLGWTAADFE